VPEHGPPPRRARSGDDLPVLAGGQPGYPRISHPAVGLL